MVQVAVMIVVMNYIFQEIIYMSVYLIVWNHKSDVMVLLVFDA